MPLDFPMNKHLDGQNVAELKRYKTNNVAVDPTGTDLVEGILWFVDADKRWKYYNGTELVVLGGTGNRKRGSFDASAGVTPLPADATVDPGVEIKDGDYFVITVAGTIAGLPGNEELEIGDLLYANMDAPATSADWYAVQTNITLADNPVAAEIVEDQDILASAPLVIYPNLFSGISSIEVFDANGLRITDSVAITLSAFATPPTSNAGFYEFATIETLVDILSPVIKIYGW